MQNGTFFATGSEGFWFLTHCRGGYDMKHVVFTFDGDDCKLHLNRLAALGFMLATLALTFTLDTMTYLKLKNMNSKLTRQSSFTKHQRASRQRCEDYVLTQTFVLPLTLLLQHALFFVRSTDFTKFDSIVLNFTFNMLVIIVIYQIEAIVELITNKSLNSFLYRLWNRRRSRERTPPESNQLLKRRGAMQTDVIVIDISK
uniref:7TM_GPCR_Srx domain-containing protein n=1 Tax=Bursaphelenchus xylophilus TaxID=6326 RepID=A0A1I7SI32_BURXY